MLEGTKIFFEDLSRNASGFEKTGQQQCSGKIKELGLIRLTATCPPVVIESGSSSFSCDLGPTVSNPTTMSSSSMVSTNIDNNDNDVE